MQIFIKNFTIISCAIYNYKRILNIPSNGFHFILDITFCVFLSAVSAAIDTSYTYIFIPLVVIASMVFFTYSNKTILPKSIPAMLISYGIAFIIFAFATTLIPIMLIIILPIHIQNHILLQSLVFLSAIIIQPLPFHLKRFKNGMPFLENQKYSTLGAIIGLTIIFAATFLTYNNYEIGYIALLIFIYIGTVLVYLYWRFSINKKYLDKLREKDFAELNAQLAVQQEQISALKQENQQLAKIIHRDNKLIPAMDYALKSYLSTAINDSTEYITEGNRLQIEIAKLSDERRNMLQQHEHNNIKLPATHVTSTDNLLKYMYEKARQDDIALQLIITCNPPQMIQQIIDEADLNTLLADLIENAIIATKHNEQHSILVSFSMVDKAYAINIFDSGIPFTTEVIQAFGKQQLTTHANTGGSGIGLMTTYELLRKYNASFIINEFDSGQYTKEISIVFNELQQYILKTYRPEEEILSLRKRNDLQIIQK